MSVSHSFLGSSKSVVKEILDYCSKKYKQIHTNVCLELCVCARINLYELRASKTGEKINGKHIIKVTLEFKMLSPNFSITLALYRANTSKRTFYFG